MRVTQKSLTAEAIENRDYRDYLTICIDGKESFCVYEGEPEDATLARDFIDSAKPKTGADCCLPDFTDIRSLFIENKTSFLEVNLENKQVIEHLHA